MASLETQYDNAEMLQKAADLVKLEETDIDETIRELDEWGDKVTNDEIEKEQSLWIFTDKKIAKKYLILDRNRNTLTTEEKTYLERLDKYRNEAKTTIANAIINESIVRKTNSNGTVVYITDEQDALNLYTVACHCHNSSTELTDVLANVYNTWSIAAMSFCGNNDIMSDEFWPSQDQ